MIGLARLGSRAERHAIRSKCGAGCIALRRSLVRGVHRVGTPITKINVPASNREPRINPAVVGKLARRSLKVAEFGPGSICEQLPRTGRRVYVDAFLRGSDVIPLHVLLERLVTEAIMKIPAAFRVVN